MLAATGLPRLYWQVIIMPEFLSKLVAMLLLAVPMQLQLVVPMQLNP